MYTFVSMENFFNGNTLSLEEVRAASDLDFDAVNISLDDDPIRGIWVREIDGIKCCRYVCLPKHGEEVSSLLGFPMVKEITEGQSFIQILNEIRDVYFIDVELDQKQLNLIEKYGVTI